MTDFDQAVYLGRRLVGFIRSIAAKHCAFDAVGSPIGEFPTRREACAAVMASPRTTAP
jgi:hypothetical protein